MLQVRNEKHRYLVNHDDISKIKKKVDRENINKQKIKEDKIRKIDSNEYRNNIDFQIFNERNKNQIKLTADLLKQTEIELKKHENNDYDSGIMLDGVYFMNTENFATFPQIKILKEAYESNDQINFDNQYSIIKDKSPQLEKFIQKNKITFEKYFKKDNNALSSLFPDIK